MTATRTCVSTFIIITASIASCLSATVCLHCVHYSGSVGVSAITQETVLRVLYQQQQQQQSAASQQHTRLPQFQRTARQLAPSLTSDKHYDVFRKVNVRQKTDCSAGTSVILDNKYWHQSRTQSAVPWSNSVPNVREIQQSETEKTVCITTC